MIPKTKRIPDSKRAQVIAALKANPNASAVAREVGGISPTSVHNIAKAAKIDLGRSGPKKVSAETQALILKALKSNPNASAIAREFGGMSYKTVTRLADKANIKFGPKAHSQTNAPKPKSQRKARVGQTADLPKRHVDASKPHVPAQERR